MALPIVLPPAVVVGAALVVFYVVELIVWVPLKLTEMVKRATGIGAPPKRANAPRLTWKL